MKIFLTGGLGFLGKYVVKALLEQGNEVALLARPSGGKSASTRLKGAFGDSAKYIDLVEGDLDNICSCNYEKPIDVLIHMAAILDLGERRKEEMWQANVVGTANVIDFCKNNHVSHLSFISTAYAQGRNTYEWTKVRSEVEVKGSGLSYSILKPSIIIGSPSDPGPVQTINHIALTIGKLHKNAESARLKVQDTLALPPFELVFRMKGDPKMSLNVIPVAIVADEIAKLEFKEGIYYITNPNPPSLKDVANEVGEALSLNVRILKEFKPSPPEKVLGRVIRAFSPYMRNGGDFTSVIDSRFKLKKGYIRDTVKAFLNSN